MKARPNHLKTLAKEFRKVIADYVNDDQQLNLLQMNIIEIDIDQSLARANVYYVTHDKIRINDCGDIEKKIKLVIANHFRSRIRRIPNIVLIYDDTYEKGRRVTELIKEFERKHNENK